MDKKIILEQEHKATGFKVFLVPMQDSEIKHLINLARDPSLTDSMGWNTFFEIDDTKKFINAISAYSLPYSRESDPVVFGAYLDPESLPIGYAVLKGFNMDLLTAEVGVAIFDNKYRAKGYGKLALNRIIMYGFDNLKIKTISSAILASNNKSINMVKNLGFVVREIMYRSWPMPNGDLVDMLWMELTRETWKSIEKK